MLTQKTMEKVEVSKTHGSNTLVTKENIVPEAINVSGTHPQINSTTQGAKAITKQCRYKHSSY